MADAASALEALMGNSCNRPRLDVTGDAALGVADVLMLGQNRLISSAASFE